MPIGFFNIAEQMLKDFTLLEILERNDLHEEDALAALIRLGFIDVEDYETEDFQED